MVKRCYCWKQAQAGTPVPVADCACSKGCKFCHPGIKAAEPVVTVPIVEHSEAMPE